MRGTARVLVAERLWGLFDSEGPGFDDADYSTGLIVPLSIGASVCAGIHRGYITVEAMVLDGAPERTHEADWDDVAEVSVYSSEGALRVSSLEDGPCGDELPVLSGHGPGWYRVRAHVRGRDCDPGKTVEDSAEEYLLLVWAAEPSPTLIIRATDSRGMGLRLADMARRRLTETPAPPAIDVDLPTRKEVLDRAIRGELGAYRKRPGGA